MFLNLGHGTLLRASQVSCTKSLCYSFISRIIWNNTISWIISLPRTISVTSQAVMLIVCFGAYCHSGTSGKTTFEGTMRKDQRYLLSKLCFQAKRGGPNYVMVSCQTNILLCFWEKSSEKNECSYASKGMLTLFKSMCWSSQYHSHTADSKAVSSK